MGSEVRYKSIRTISPLWQGRGSENGRYVNLGRERRHPEASNVSYRLICDHVGDRRCLVSCVVVEDGLGHPERGRVEAEPVSLGHPFTKLDDPLRKVIGAEPASELRDRRRVAGFTLRLTLP